MFSIQPCPMPSDALLRRYLQQHAFTDCYAVDIAGAVSQSQYVAAFYTTRAFKLERLILKWAVARPSTDTQAEELAAGARDSFAAWHVEDRCENQLLLCDFQGRTRSWLMVAPIATAGNGGTRLYFGSAVVATKRSATGGATIGSGFRLLLGFHKIYSKVLLHAAKSRLQAQRRSAGQAGSARP